MSLCLIAASNSKTLTFFTVEKLGYEFFHSLVHRETSKYIVAVSCCCVTAYSSQSAVRLSDLRVLVSFLTSLFFFLSFFSNIFPFHWHSFVFSSKANNSLDHRMYVGYNCIPIIFQVELLANSVGHILVRTDAYYCRIIKIRKHYVEYTKYLMYLYFSIVDKFQITLRYATAYTIKFDIAFRLKNYM